MKAMFQTTNQICVLLYPFVPVLFAHDHLKVCEMSRKINAWLLVNLPWPLAELGTKIDAFVHIKRTQRDTTRIFHHQSAINQHQLSLQFLSGDKPSTIQPWSIKKGPKKVMRSIHHYSMCSKTWFSDVFRPSLRFSLPDFPLTTRVTAPGPAPWERRLQRRRHHPADPHRVPGQAATNHQRVPWTAQLAAGSGMVMMVMKWWLVKLLWIVFAAKCIEIYWNGGWWWFKWLVTSAWLGIWLQSNDETDYIYFI